MLFPEEAGHKVQLSLVLAFWLLPCLLEGHQHDRDHGQQDCSLQLLQYKLGLNSSGLGLVLRTVTPRLQH